MGGLGDKGILSDSVVCYCLCCGQREHSSSAADAALHLHLSTQAGVWVGGDEVLSEYHGQGFRGLKTHCEWWWEPSIPTMESLSFLKLRCQPECIHEVRLFEDFFGGGKINIQHSSLCSLGRTTCKVSQSQPERGTKFPELAPTEWPHRFRNSVTLGCFLPWSQKMPLKLKVGGMLKFTTFPNSKPNAGREFGLPSFFFFDSDQTINKTFQKMFAFSSKKIENYNLTES